MTRDQKSVASRAPAHAPAHEPAHAVKSPPGSGGLGDLGVAQLVETAVSVIERQDDLTVVDTLGRSWAMRVETDPSIRFVLSASRQPPVDDTGVAPPLQVVERWIAGTAFGLDRAHLTAMLAEDVAWIDRQLPPGS
jgi:hypothetical protein